MSKDEIINMIAQAIKPDPFLINRFSRGEGEKTRVNIDAISGKIAWITNGELDYYHIDDAVYKLYEIKNIADRLKEENSFKDADDMYYVLLEGCVDAFDEGADDSGGGMGDLAISCIKDFNECVEQINDPAYNNRLLGKIMDLVKREDYGIEKLGMPDERLQLAMRELVDKEDYYRLAKILLEEKRFEEAFDAAKKGLLMPGESHYLNDIYFDIARKLLGLRPDIIDFNLSLLMWRLTLCQDVLMK